MHEEEGAVVPAGAETGPEAAQAGELWAGGDGEPREAGLVRIPLYRAEASAGAGRTVHQEDEYEEVESAEYLPEAYVRAQYGVKPSRVFDIRVRGNSMHDTISPGERVRCVQWEGEQLVDGAIYIVRGPWGVLIKRLIQKGATLTLRSDNERYGSTDLERDLFEDQYQVIAWLEHVTHQL